MSILIGRLHINCGKSCLFGCQQIDIIVKTTVVVKYNSDDQGPKRPSALILHEIEVYPGGEYT